MNEVFLDDSYNSDNVKDSNGEGEDEEKADLQGIYNR